MTKTKKQRLSQELIDANRIATAKQRIANLGLDPEEIMPKLQEKMGMYACDFVFQAVRYPGELCNRTKEPFKKSKALISAYADDPISDEQLAKALGAKTKKEAEAKAIKIQEFAMKYRAQKDLQALIHDPVEAIQQEAAQRQQQTESRITNRTTRSTRSNKITTNSTAPQKPRKPTFTLEPVNQELISQTQPTQRTTASATEVKVDAPEISDDSLRNKAREELAKLKEGKKGELTLDELTKAGINEDDMANAVTKENMTEIHAGKSGKKSGQAAPKYHKRRGCARNVRLALEAGGFKGSTYDPNEKIKSGIYKGNVENGTTQCRTLRKKDGYYTFEFESNMSGNPEIANLKEPGTYIGWEAKTDSIEPRGHGAIMDTKGTWHGGCSQSSTYMSGTEPINRYKSDTYTIGFFGDCTASDKLAEDMIYQKLVRERDKQLAQEKTQETQMPQTMIIAQNTH